MTFKIVESNVKQTKYAKTPELCSVLDKSWKVIKDYFMLLVIPLIKSSFHNVCTSCRFYNVLHRTNDAL